MANFCGACGEPQPITTPECGCKMNLKDSEDRVALWLNGGSCQKTTHEGAEDLDKLVMLKMLRIDMPHQSTQIHEIEAAIARQLKVKPE